MKSSLMLMITTQQNLPRALSKYIVIFHLLLMKKSRRQLSSKSTHRIPWGVKVPVLLSVASSLLAVVVHHNIAISLHLQGGLNISLASNDPVFLLHVGPHKTATSTIQCDLTRYHKELYESAHVWEGPTANA